MLLPQGKSMVRSALLRRQKYESKIDADVSRTRILALKSGMVSQMEAATADLATLEAEVKRVIEGQTTAIFGYQIPAYLNVARELFRLSRKFTGTTFASEAEVVLAKWDARGLEVWALSEIAALFGVSYP